MPTPSLIPFTLEDFFDQYEHRGDLINLASSDGLPWTMADLRDKGIRLPLTPDTSLQYPDTRAVLGPGLSAFCSPPPGVSVLATSGAAEAMALVMHELSASDGRPDERPVGLPRLAFGAFHGLASMLGIATEAYDYEPSRGWTPDVDRIMNLTARCRALIVINPHNPTGSVIPDDVMAAIANEVATRDGFLVVNEVFRTPDETAPAIGLGPHVVVLGSFSKIYGLPGLRLGWIAATEKRLKRYRTVQQYLSLSLNAMTVAWGADVLQKAEAFNRTDLIRKNRRLLKTWVTDQKGAVSISPCEGGTTACLTVVSTLAESTLFDEFVRAGVLLIPGAEAFHSAWKHPWFRLGYGGDSERLKAGLDLIANVIKPKGDSGHSGRDPVS